MSIDDVMQNALETKLALDTAIVSHVEAARGAVITETAQVCLVCKNTLTGLVELSRCPQCGVSYYDFDTDDR